MTKLLYLLPLGFISWVIYLFGFFWYRVTLKEGSYSPADKTRFNCVQIWHNSSIIYSDWYVCPESKRRETDSIHEAMAKDFLKTLK